MYAFLSSVVLLFYAYRRNGSCLPSKSKTQPEHNDIFFIKIKSNNQDHFSFSFLTKRDMLALHSFKSFQNNITGLLKIGIVPSISLLFCPLTLFLYTPIVNYCWPKDRFSSPPNINDAISCFLVPAGMVYAFVFGFALQQVYGQYRETEEKINTEIDIVREMMSLVGCISHVSRRDYFRVLILLKERIVDRILIIQNMTLHVVDGRFFFVMVFNDKTQLSKVLVAFLTSIHSTLMYSVIMSIR